MIILSTSESIDFPSIETKAEVVEDWFLENERRDNSILEFSESKIGLKDKELGQIGVIRIEDTEGWTMGPPAASE